MCIVEINWARYHFVTIRKFAPASMGFIFLLPLLPPSVATLLHTPLLGTTFDA